MARIEGIRDRQANAFTRFVYGAVRRKIGRVPEPMRITAHQPRLLAALAGMEMAQEAMRTVDPVVKALVGIKTAMLIGCPFLIDIGSAVGRKAGVSEAKLMGLVDFEGSPEFTEVEKLALRYAVAMTATPVEMADDLFDAMQAHFNQRQLVELTSAIAWENYRARFDHAFGCEAEGYSEGAFCPLPR